MIRRDEVEARVLKALQHKLLRQTPGDLQKHWIGHSSLRTTDRYSHTDEELEFRREAALKVGIQALVGPNGPNLTTQTPASGEALPAVAAVI